MPRQHRPTHAVTDVRNGIARRFSQGHARGESVPVPGKAKTLLLKIRDHAIARSVAAGRGDLYGKFRQDCPQSVCARRVFRMERANRSARTARSFASSSEIDAVAVKSKTRI